MTSRMQVKYKEEIVSALMERFKYKNIMEVPKLNKIVINIGLGSAKDNPKVLESALRDFLFESYDTPFQMKIILLFQVSQQVSISSL